MIFKKESNNIAITEDQKVRITFDCAEIDNKKIIYSTEGSSEIFYIEDNLNGSCEVFLKPTSSRAVIEALESALPILGFDKGVAFSVIEKTGK